jgi:hypothetical protein
VPCTRIANSTLRIQDFPVPVELNEVARTEPVAKKRARWWRNRTFLIISIIVHLLFGAGAAYLVISRDSSVRKLTFAPGPKSPNPSERALEHRVQMQGKNMTAPAAVPKRVLTTAAAKVELPPMPSIPAAPMQAAPPKMAAAGGVSLGVSESAAGSPGGMGNGAAINFFGIRDKSSSVVIMIDVSDSMFTRTGDAEHGTLIKHGKDQSFQTVRDEAIKLIASLGPNVNFGVIRWAGGAYSWQPELVPATTENKTAAISHIQDEVDMKKARPQKGHPGGTRHDYALEQAFRLKPETIYMLTDGNATAAQPGGGLHPIPPEELFKVAEAGQQSLTKRARLHIIYYLDGKEKAEERQMLMSLASRNNGQFRQVTAPGRKG